MKFVLLLNVVALFAMSSLAVQLNRPFTGYFTYYNDAGYGACGQPLNARTQMLVAVSKEWFTSANPNKDPVCGKCLRVDYKGRSIKVPIKDKCYSCPRNHMDLSQPAFAALENLGIGRAYNAKFTFVNC